MSAKTNLGGLLSNVTEEPYSLFLILFNRFR
jgi:hypothetical protein